MTSKKAMLALMTLVLTGCSDLAAVYHYFEPPAAALVSPYTYRHVWAVAPLRNESGSAQADGLALADHLQRQLANTRNLDVLPVNRTIQAMEALGLRQVSTPAQAMQLLRTLGVDGLVVGTITAYNPYDPPKLGLALELYTGDKSERLEAVNLRGLTISATDRTPSPPSSQTLQQPVSVVSAVLDASDPRTRDQLEHYGVKRGPQDEPDAWRRYRISMDLYSEFAAYVMSWRLLDVEKQRLGPSPTTQPVG